MKSKLDNMLLELKDTSEMMVDLAYSSLLYNNNEIAEEVVTLSGNLQNLAERIQDELVQKGQAGPQDITKALVTTRLQSSIMDIAYAAESIANVVIRGLAEHPVLAMSIRDSDTTLCLAKIADGSPLAGKTMGDIRLATNCGMFVIAIRRDNDYIFGPGKQTKMEIGDILIARGPEEGVGYFKDLADGTEREIRSSGEGESGTFPQRSDVFSGFALPTAFCLRPRGRVRRRSRCPSGWRLRV